MDKNVYYTPPTQEAPAAPAPNGQSALAAPTAYQPTYGLPPKKTYSPLAKKDNLFVFLFLAAAFIFVDFALFHGFHLGFTIAYAVIFVLATVYLWDKNGSPNVFSLACGAVSLVGAATFALYSNEFMNVIMVLLIAGMFTLYCLGISNSYSHQIGNFKMLIDLFTGALIEPFENLGDIVGSLKAGADKSKKNLSALFGVLVAIPVLVVIVPLLISSDAAFENLIGVIAKNIGQYLLELAIAIVVTPLLFSFFYGKRKKINANHQSVGHFKRRIPVSGSVSFLSVISFTYLVYLFSQLAYFFSAFGGLLPEGYTRSASAFARRGFYEMFAICAINVVIISAVSMLTKRKKGKVSAGIKVLSLFISLFSVLMIITAIQKMKLNITTYGFTRNRLLVFVFMLMTLVVICFFILHIFVPKLSYMQPIILICSVMFVALSFMNIDAFTFEQNYQAYQKGTLEKMDLYTISTLNNSDLYYVRLAEKNDEKLSHKAVVKLIEDYFDNDYMENPYQLKDGAVTVKEQEKKRDFRSWCRDDRLSETAVLDYYNSLSADGKKAFDDTAEKLVRGSYDSSEDVIYLYDTTVYKDVMFAYNPQTGMYDIQTVIGDNEA